MPLMSLNSKLLSQVEGGITHVNTEYPISGNGVNEPVGLAINPLTSVSANNGISGNGTNASPIGLSISPLTTVSTNNSISGNGTNASPIGLTINPLTSVSTNRSISGNGTTNSPIGLTIDPLTTVATTGIITGNGTSNRPIGSNFDPNTKQNKLTAGDGIDISNDTISVTAASVPTVTVYRNLIRGIQPHTITEADSQAGFFTMTASATPVDNPVNTFMNHECRLYFDGRMTFPSGCQITRNNYMSGAGVNTNYIGGYGVSYIANHQYSNEIGFTSNVSYWPFVPSSYSYEFSFGKYILPVGTVVYLDITSCGITVS